ncbi:MAG: DUF938 domain-containing protein [Myxococcales bacterium]|nr:DUF938 domain-containing protein [Myxococcales bacterium]
MTDARRTAPSAARNREPILAALREVLPREGTVLELAAGSGEHARWYAEAFGGLRWIPSDRDPSAVASIEAWREGASANLEPARVIDVRSDDWGVGKVDAVLCINMIHIAPWSAGEAMLDGAARHLNSSGVLFLYGAYKRNGAHTAPSNETFDQWLKSQDPEFGVRDLEAVLARADRAGLALDRVIEMPANNLSVVLQRRK